MSAISGGSLKMNLKEILSSGLFSDLTICCGGKEFKVHKNILYLQSPFFRKLLGGDFKEASKNQDKIQLDDDPDAINVMLLYLYAFVYDDSIHKGKDHMCFTVKVYAVADKYDIPMLRSMAAKRLHVVCDPIPNLEDFIATIYAVDSCCNPTDRTLWDIIIPKIQVNIVNLLTKSEFKNAIDEVPQLKFDLLSLVGPPNRAAPAIGAFDVESRGNPFG